MQNLHKKVNNEFQNDVLVEMCENEKIHVIAFNENCILAKDIKTNKAHFVYTTSPDKLDSGMTFDFSLLHECTTFAENWFLETIKILKMHLEIKETSNDYFQIILND